MAGGGAEQVDGGPPHRTAGWFPWALAAVAVVALAVRVAYVLVERRDLRFEGDAIFYHAGANQLADGKGLISPFFRRRAVQAGEHPPLYLVYLAIPSWFGLTSTLTHLLWSCVAGSAAVVVVGLLGREVGGARVGITAAAIGAVYPNLWVFDGSMMAESMAILTVASVLLLAYRYWRQPSVARLTAVGAASGVAALSRSELILFVPLLIAPLALVTGSESKRRRVRWLGLGTLAALVVAGPWVAFNLTRFREPELLSAQSGALLAAANCDEVYYAEHLSYFSPDCTEAIRKREIGDDLDQSEADRIYRRVALDYIWTNRQRVPLVVVARLGSILGVYHPGLQMRIDSLIEGRELWVARAGLYSFYPLTALAVVGVIILRARRTAPVFPLLVPPAIVLITVALAYAATRFRAPAEVAVVVLAGLAVDAAASTLRSRARGAGGPR